MIVSILLVVQAIFVFYYFSDRQEWPHGTKYFAWPQLVAAAGALVFGYSGGILEGFFTLSLGSTVGWWVAEILLVYAGVIEVKMDDKIKRGAQVVDAKTLSKMARQQGECHLSFCGVPLPYKMENRHFLLTGTTGAGKSQAFYDLAEQARERGDSAIVPDVGGQSLSRFYREGEDVILSPHDTRSPGWSPLAEMSAPWDSERIAKSIIPDGQGSSSEWNHYSQVLLSAILLKTWQARGSNGDLAQAILYSSNQELGALVAGTTAQMQFAEGADKMLASIRAILSSYTAWIQDLPAHVGAEGFSVTRFVKTASKSVMAAGCFSPFAMTNSSLSAR